MHTALLLTVLAQAAPSIDEAVPPVEPEAVTEQPSVAVPGVRIGFGPALAVNALPHNDLAGLSFGLHGDLALTRGRLEARLSSGLTAFAGWNGRDGFGYLITASAEVSLRYHLFERIAFGVGVMPAISAGSFPRCGLDYLSAFGGSGCALAANYLYGSVAPTVYPIIATLGDHHQQEIAVWLSWPIAWSGAYTFPTAMISYTHMF